MTILVDVESGKDLIPVTLYEAHDLSVIELAEAINKKVLIAKQNKDKAHEKATQLFDYLPTFILGPFATIASYIGQNVGISIPALGVKADNWGQMVITNVGSIGLAGGYAPIVPLMCTMIVACTGKIEKKAVVVNDEIVIRPIMNVIYSIDHRYADASVGIKFLNIIKDFLDSPDTFKIDKYPQTTPYNDPNFVAKKT